MNKALQRVVARLPQYWRQMLKQWSSRRQIKAGRFRIPEKEYDILPKYLKQGDWVLDVGANIRHYTVRFAELVGPTGRVIAFEPMSATFSLLAANIESLPHNNVTLLNAAASDVSAIAACPCHNLTAAWKIIMKHASPLKKPSIK